jgi:hypothetical protein
VDADLILEALINRQGLIIDCRNLLERSHPFMQVYLTDLGWQKIYDYTSRLSNQEVAEIVLNWLQARIWICSVAQTTIQQARLSPLKDFESAVELVCAIDYQLDAIVTHNLDHFATDAQECLIWSMPELWVRVNLEIQLQAVNFDC